MASLSLSGITLRLGDRPVLRDVSLDVADGEVLAITGPSGSGKTSLLRVAAGLARPESGSVSIGGEDVTRVPPAGRRVSMVFQEYPLFGDRTAERNIVFPLEVRGVGPDERRRRAYEEAKALGIEAVLPTRAGRLAAGHRQVVATARALVREGRVLLMDEPLVHLDARARVAARLQMGRLHRETGMTVLYVTNDQVEAMALGDRVAVLEDGRLLQVGPPLGVYRRPAHRFVGEFLGDPAMRMLDGSLVQHENALHAEVGGQRIRLSDEAVVRRPGLEDWLGMPVTVGFRADALVPARGGEPFLECLRGEVVAVHQLGAEGIADVEVGAGVPLAIRVRFPGGPGEGDRVELRVLTDRLAFFDPVWGNAIGWPGPPR